MGAFAGAVPGVPDVGRGSGVVVGGCVSVAVGGMGVDVGTAA